MEILKPIQNKFQFQSVDDGALFLAIVNRSFTNPVMLATHKYCRQITPYKNMPRPTS